MRAITPKPASFVSQMPLNESSDQEPHRAQHADDVADLHGNVDLDQRQHDEQESEDRHHAIVATPA